MPNRKAACVSAALFVGSLFTVSVAQSVAATPLRDVIVKGPRFNPELQRRVSYADLNLAFKPGQQKLATRIYRTATGLCHDINGFHSYSCVDGAVDSTDGQVAAAIARAKRQMAGLPVGPAIAISMVIAH